MFWFVNPHNEKRAINLNLISSINVKKDNIYLDNHVWVFENEKQAKEVYESIIKLGQQTRYRAKE